MKHTLESITNKPGDYKICINCGALNWYENEVCRDCHDICNTTDFDENESSVLDWVRIETKYWIEHEGYSMDNTLLVEVYV